jgi:hypothetical protein
LFYGDIEVGSLTLMEGRGMGMFENKVLRKKGESKTRMKIGTK